jgi:hypothetical protein
MKDGLHPGRRPAHYGLVPNIALDEPEPIPVWEQIFTMPRGEIIQHPDFIPPVQEGIHNVRADKAGPACN